MCWTGSSSNSASASRDAGRPFHVKHSHRPQAPPLAAFHVEQPPETGRALGVDPAHASPDSSLPRAGDLAVLGELCPDMAPGDRQAAATALLGHLQILGHWNARLNLVSEADYGAVWERHVVPSLQLRSSILGVRHESVVDLGSGAGFPGIPLAITSPSSRFTLVESRRRRASFLRAVVRELSLDNAEVVHERIEEWRPRPQADVVLARAVADPARIATLVAHVLAPDGFLLVTLPPASGPAGQQCGARSSRHTFWQPFSHT